MFKPRGVARIYTQRVNNSIKNESLDVVFKFMEEIKLIAEPSIFIQAVAVPLEIFNQIFSSLKKICEKRTSFTCFDFLGEQFLDNILNIMSIEDHESHLFIVQLLIFFWCHTKL